jgi:hypothetical protein
MLFRHIAPEASVIVVQAHVLARVNTTIRDARPAAAGKASLFSSILSFLFIPHIYSCGIFLRFFPQFFHIKVLRAGIRPGVRPL